MGTRVRESVLGDGGVRVGTWVKTGFERVSRRRWGYDEDSGETVTAFVKSAIQQIQYLGGIPFLVDVLVGEHQTQVHIAGITPKTVHRRTHNVQAADCGRKAESSERRSGGSERGEMRY